MALDTGSERCSVALLHAGTGRIVARADPVIGRGHAERLMPLVEQVLGEAGVGWEAVGRVGVGIGPGSFTGIRVALAAAHGLSLSLECPLVGVSSLEALAEPHGTGETPVLAVQDAKRGEVYAALFAPGGAILEGPAALAPAALVDFVDPVSPSRLLLVGSGASIAAGVLGGHDVRIVSEDGAPDIAAVARLAAAATPGGEVRALYLRGADARPSSAPSLVASVETSP
nr:tRNA (adenosine(37)-N6)-threonylcarbamoyltransferase complex dimerization subunit type 1 TsaB [Aureimonas jatrophae]